MTRPRTPLRRPRALVNAVFEALEQLLDGAPQGFHAALDVSRPH
jgi:hypothetical protein